MSKKFGLTSLLIPILSSFFVSNWAIAVAVGPVNPNITQINFTTSPQSIDVNATSTVLTVQTQSATGTSEQVGTPITLNLLSSSGTGEFSASSTNWVAVTSLNMNSNWANRSFYYCDSTAGTPTLTVTAQGQSWTPATQTITINPVLVPDTVNPTISIVSPADGTITNDNRVSSLNFTASDNEDNLIDYIISVDGVTDALGQIVNGTQIGTSLTIQPDGVHTILIKVTDNVGNTASDSITATIDTSTPDIVSVKKIDANTVEIIFSEELQNNLEGHHPSISDFDVYNANNNDLSYGVESVTYVDKKITIVLINPIKIGDDPKLRVTPALTSLVDLAGNYFNGGNSYEADVSFETIPEIIASSTPSSSGHSGQGYFVGWAPTILTSTTTGQVLGTSTNKYSDLVRQKRLRHFRIRLFQIKYELLLLEHPELRELIAGITASTSTTTLTSTTTDNASTTSIKKPFWRFW